jgi:hypothetical protein
MGKRVSSEFKRLLAERKLLKIKPSEEMVLNELKQQNWI